MLNFAVSLTVPPKRIKVRKNPNCVLIGHPMPISTQHHSYKYAPTKNLVNCKKPTFSLMDVAPYDSFYISSAKVISLFQFERNYMRISYITPDRCINLYKHAFKMEFQTVWRIERSRVYICNLFTLETRFLLDFTLSMKFPIRYMG